MRALAVALLVLALTGCGSTSSSGGPGAGTLAASTSTSTSTSTTGASRQAGSPASADTSAAPPAGSAAGTTPPSWLGTRVLPKDADGFGVVRPTPKALRHRRWTLPDTLPMLPGKGFQARVQRAPKQVIARSTWAPGCPVGKRQLDWVRLTFWGFDGRRHAGELLVNHSASAAMVTVFKRLYAARWPFEQMHITTKAEAEAPPTGDGNNTSAFNCRVVRGASELSQHAYGLAIDVDPFQNPYVKGKRVLPELASWYLDRGRHTPGIITAAGPVVRAFRAVGWGWGGSWQHLKDYEHFSANGR